MNLEQVVVAAGDVVAFGHLGNLADDVAELVGHLLVERRELDATEDDETAVDLLGIEHGDITLDEALALHALDALEDGRGAEIDLAGNLLDGETRVLLQAAQNLDVGFVQCDAVTGPARKGVVGLCHNFYRFDIVGQWESELFSNFAAKIECFSN